MLKLRKSLQVSLTFDESERVLLTRMLNYILVTTVAIVLILLPFSYRLVFSSPIRAGLTIAVLAINLVGWFLLRKGFLIQTSAWLILGYWTAVLVLVLASGGIESPWLVTQVAVAAIAGLLLGGWGGIIFAALTLGADWFIDRLQASGAIPLGMLAEGPIDNWLALFASFSLVSVAILMAGSLAQTAMRRARQNERRFSSLFNKTNDLIIWVSLDQRILNVNQPAADLLGYEVSELIGKPYAEIVNPDERASFISNFERLKVEKLSPLFERTLVHKDGSRVKMEFHVALISDEKDQPLYFQGVGRDIRERKRLEAQLRFSLDEMEKLAMQDSLTELLNRRAITEHAEAEWARAQRDHRPMCLVLIDLDNLKIVNDSLGHQMGDQVILELAGIIKTSKRRYDWAGRWGGDEFMLVLPGTNLVEATQVAERLRITYMQSALVKRMSGEALLSLGIACYSGRKSDETDLNKLISQADRALYRAKERGKNRVEVYLDESKEEI